MTPADLKTFMSRNRIPGEVLYLNVPTPTVEAAAEAVDAAPEAIIKSILFMVSGQPVLAITCGTDRVDQRAIAALYGVGRKRVKLAAPDEVLAVAGYEVGAMPPFGHRQPLNTLLDQRVVEKPMVYGGGGAENALVQISPAEILRVSQAQVMDLLNPPGGTPPT